MVEGDLQIAFPRHRHWLLTLRGRSSGKNITRAYRMAASRFLGLAANGRSRVSPPSPLGTYADLAIMWIQDMGEAPTAVDQRLARISLSA